MWFFNNSPVVRWGLVSWLLLISTAPAVCDQHAGGDVPHVHGLNLFPLPIPTADETSPCRRHFHLVILGVEFYLAGDHDGRPSPDPISSPALTAESLPGPSSWDNTASVDAVPDTSLPPLAAAASAGCLPDSPFTVDSLCDLAHGHRSGAQRC